MIELTDLEKKALKYLIDKKYVNIITLARETNISYPTVKNIARVLEIGGYIKINKIGNNKFLEVIDRDHEGFI